MSETIKPLHCNDQPLRKRVKTNDLSREIENLKEQVKKLEIEANQISIQVETKKCKVKRSEFVRMAEEQERGRMREKMEDCKVQVRAAQVKSTTADSSLNSNRKLLQDITKYKESLLAEVAALRAASAKKQALLSDKKGELVQLERRREAMLGMLTNQKQTYHNQIVKYNALLHMDDQQQP